MKKILLLLSALFTFGAVMAQDPVVSITTVSANQKAKISSYSSSFKLGEPNSELTWTAANYNNNNNGWENIRCGSKNAASNATITTDFAISEAIGQVGVEVERITTGTNNAPTGITLLVSANSDMSEATTYTGNVSDVPNTKNGTATINIVVDQPAENMYYQVCIAMPKTGSNGTVAVNSLSYYNGTFTPEVPEVPELTEYATIAEFLAAKPSTDGILKDLTAIYKNGRYLYTTDGKDFLLVYNASDIEDLANLAVANGDKFASVTGSYKSNNGVEEIIPTAIGEKTTGTAVNPEVLAIEEISSTMINHFVKLEGVSIKNTKTNNYDLTDETGTIVLYNPFSNASYYDVIEVPEGENFDVTGFVSIYGDVLQITPMEITGGKVIETVETPVITPASGELAVGDKITITCATEGASIYFTTEDETPSKESQLYTGEITYTEPVTIRAIAVKDGYYDSKVAEATFTTVVEGVYTMSLNFNDGGNIAEVYSGTKEIAPGNESTEVGTNNLDGTTFVLGAVNVLLEKNTGSTSPKWWATTTANPHFRVYNGNKYTISVVQNGYKLTSFKFVKGNNAVSASNFSKIAATVDTNNGADEFGSTSKTWTVKEGEVVNQLMVNITYNGQCGGIEITYEADDNALAGIEDVVYDIENNNAAVEYFNLQGVRVNADNVTPGIYIRRQGNETTKVLVK